MNQQILSQDEVDALLQGITGESQKLEQEETPEGAIRNYDLASQERIRASLDEASLDATSEMPTGGGMAPQGAMPGAMGK